MCNFFCIFVRENQISLDMNKIFLLLFIFFFYSCSHYSPEVEAILKHSGSNSRELKKVLKHYSQKPADRLKLRAAEFLIVNMPGKYSEYYDAPWNDVATVRMRWTSSPDKQRVLDAYGLSAPIREDDITHITADYLIRNIELAFKMWQERPWGKYIPFETFCEEILPYRVGTEPLENWREKALASFAGLERELNNPKMTAVEACRLVNQALPKFTYDDDFPHMNFLQLMATARGSCVQMSAIALFSMRALGIPVTMEFYPLGVNRHRGHTWSSVSDSSGKHIVFMGSETEPGQFALPDEPFKIYRNTYSLEHSIKMTDNHSPHFLKTGFGIIDITAQYLDVCDVDVEIKYPLAISPDYVYLACRDLDRWQPIAWAVNSGQVVRFSSMKKNQFYLPVYYVDGVQTPAGSAFLLDESGTVTDISLDYFD
jgi:hypothetical protein